MLRPFVGLHVTLQIERINRYLRLIIFLSFNLHDPQFPDTSVCTIRRWRSSHTAAFAPGRRLRSRLPRGPLASSAVPHIHRWTSSRDKMTVVYWQMARFPLSRLRRSAGLQSCDIGLCFLRDCVLIHVSGSAMSRRRGQKCPWKLYSTPININYSNCAALWNASFIFQTCLLVFVELSWINIWMWPRRPP